MDCGVDFTDEQLEAIASRHDRLGFSSVQILDGRLRVLAQELAHVATARRMVDSEFPECVPTVHGNKEGKQGDPSILLAALKTCGVPCQVQGNVDYTINPSQIEIRSTPLQITYDDSESHFSMRGDTGEIQLVRDSGEAQMTLRGNAILELAGWRIVADEFQTQDTTAILRGNIQFHRPDEPGAVIERSGEIRISTDADSLEEIIANALQE